LGDKFHRLFDVVSQVMTQTPRSLRYPLISVD
jgi:hypothetical protein